MAVQGQDLGYAERLGSIHANDPVRGGMRHEGIPRGGGNLPICRITIQRVNDPSGCQRQHTSVTEQYRGVCRYRPSRS